MINNKYVLNSTLGINKIERISLKDIIRTFSFPNEIEIKLNKNKISLDVDLKYSGLEVYYTLHYFVENLDKPDDQSLIFSLEKLYLSEKESIKIGEELKIVLSKIRKYLKKNKKKSDFEYIEDKYDVRYLFDDGNIDLFFDKCGYKKILRTIMISLPYEDIIDDNKILEEIKDVMELRNTIKKMFF